MKVRVDINTAKMRELMKAAEGSPRYVIHDGVEYGVYQEFTSRGHPSLVPAVEQVVPTLSKAVGLALEAGVSLDEVLNKAAKDIQTLWAGDVNIDTGAYQNSITSVKVK